MTQEELIAKQQLEIEELKKLISSNSAILIDLKTRFTSGSAAPLNDNIYQFTNEQIKWLWITYNLIREIKTKP